MTAFSKEDDLQARYAQIPADFPRCSITSSLPGAQTKFSTVKYRDKFYLEGCTPPEILERWEICEDLALLFVEKCRNNETGKYAHLSREEVLEQYCKRLMKTDWGSDAEMKWVIRHTAELLAWPVPAIAIDKPAQSSDNRE